FLSRFLVKRLCNRPIELKFDKLGCFFLKGDIVSLIFLVGLVIMGVGVFFKVRNYESTVKDMDTKVKESQANLKQANDDLKMFKEYDLSLNLNFDSSFDYRALAYSLSKRKGNEAPHIVSIPRELIKF